MRSGRKYSHPRFMDVAFVTKQLGFYGGRYKFKAIWLVHGREVGVITKHELTRERALEFQEAR